MKILHFFCVLIVFCASTVSGAIVDDGEYFIDTNTNLRWIDPNSDLLQGMTYADAEIYLASIGFHIATLQEISTLAAGNNWGGGNLTVQEYNKIRTDLLALQPDFVTQNSIGVDALFDDETPPDNSGWDIGFYHIDLLWYPNSNFGEYMPDWMPNQWIPPGPTTRGYWAVSNNPVPVPTSIVLVGSGLVGIAGIRRKWKKRCYTHSAQ